MAIFLLPAPARWGGGERAKGRGYSCQRGNQNRGLPSPAGRGKVGATRASEVGRRGGAKQELPTPAGRGEGERVEGRATLTSEAIKAEDYPRQRGGAKGLGKAGATRTSGAEVRERREGYPRQRGGAKGRGKTRQGVVLRLMSNISYTQY